MVGGELKSVECRTKKQKKSEKGDRKLEQKIKLEEERERKR